MQTVQRAKQILLTPRAEWQVIDEEKGDPRDLYTRYIVPLAAIGPVASLIGMSIIGIRLPFMDATFRVPFGSALVHTLITYALSLAAIYVLAIIIDALAPTFAGSSDRTQALKVAAYSSTASWLAGIFALIPLLGILGLLGLYSIYLLYTGLPALMKAPQEKALAYTAVVVLAAIVLWVVIGVIAGSFIHYPMANFGPGVAH